MSGIYDSDVGNVAVTAGSAAYDSANAGNHAVNIARLTLSVSASGNYALSATSVAGSGRIDPAILTYTAEPASRLYGAANPGFKGTVSGFVPGESQASAINGTLAFATGATAASNVGSYAINGSGLSAANYLFVQAGANAAALSITPAPLTITGARVYDASTGFATGQFAVTGGVNGETVTLIGGNGTAFSADVGRYVGSPLSGLAIAVDGGNARVDNYVLPASGTLTIAKRPINVTADAQSRAYGDANPVLSYAVGGQGLAGGDTLAGRLATTATTISNIGAYAITQGTITAAANPNYALTYVGANLSVTPRAITVVVDAQSRIYGTANPALTYIVGGAGLANNDRLAGSLDTIATDASNVGGYPIAQGTVTNDVNSNYAIAYTGAMLSVTPRPLVVTASANNKTYDGTTGAAAVPTVTSGSFYGGDSGTFMQSYGTANVGTGLMLTPTGTISDNNNGANYRVTYRPSNNGTIAPATLTYSATPASRTYGAANSVLTGGVTGFVNGENRASATTGTLAFATGATSASNVGGYAVTGSGLVANNGNYVFRQAAGNAAAVTITPYLLTVGGERAYDSTTRFATAALTVSGAQNGETVTLTSGSGTAASTNVDSYAKSPLAGLAIAVAGGNASAANYALPASGTLVIDQRALTVAADAQSRVYGNVNPALTYTVGGQRLVAGDTLSGMLATAATPQSGVGAYAIGRGTLAASGNYALTYLGNTLAVTPRALVVTPDAVARIYGNANPATGTARGDSLVNADTVASVSLSSPATAASGVGSYALSASNAIGSGLGNYAVTYETRANGLAVTPRSVTIAANGQVRVYGDANPALTYTVGGQGLANGDTLSGILSTAATPQSNVGSYAIGQGSLAATANYQVNYTGATLVVGQRPLTITADSQSRLTGEPNSALTYTVTGRGLANGDRLTGILATAATAASAPDLYPIVQGSLAATANYLVTYLPGSLLVGAPRLVPLGYRASSQVRDTYSTDTSPQADDATLAIDTSTSTTTVTEGATLPASNVCPHQTACQRGR